MADDDTTADDGHTDDNDLDDAADTSTDDTGSGDDGGEDDADDWTPPSREDFEKLVATAEARKADARKLRAELRAANAPKKAAAKKAPAAAAKVDDADDGADDAPDDRWKTTAARQDVAAALLEAGFTGGRKEAREFASLGGLANITVDDEGIANDDDVEDVVEHLKAKYSGMFAQPDAGGDEKPAPTRRPTTADKTARDRRAPETGTSRTSNALMRQGGYRR